MYRVLLATDAPGRLAAFAAALQARCELSRVPLAQSLEAAARLEPQLVVVDQRGAPQATLKLLQDLLRQDAMMNLAVLSDLSPESFHHTYEGLGVLAQLPLRPGRKEAQALLERLQEVAGPWSSGVSSGPSV